MTWLLILVTFVASLYFAENARTCIEYRWWDTAAIAITASVLCVVVTGVLIALVVMG